MDNFEDIIEDNEIIMESLINDVADESSFGYKVMRKLQTNRIALAHQLNEQKKDLSMKYQKCETDEMPKEALIQSINKRKEGVQRKINGKEIKHKAALQKFIMLYDEYLNKLK